MAPSQDEGVHGPSALGGTLPASDGGVSAGDPDGPLVASNLEVALTSLELLHARASGDAGVAEVEARYRSARETQLKLLREAGLEAPGTGADGGADLLPGAARSSPSGPR